MTEKIKHFVGRSFQSKAFIEAKGIKAPFDNTPVDSKTFPFDPIPVNSPIGSCARLLMLPRLSFSPIMPAADTIAMSALLARSITDWDTRTLIGWATTLLEAYPFP